MIIDTARVVHRYFVLRPSLESERQAVSRKPGAVRPSPDSIPAAKAWHDKMLGSRRVMSNKLGTMGFRRWGK
jgi:hypothetical protein